MEMNEIKSGYLIYHNIYQVINNQKLERCNSVTRYGIIKESGCRLKEHPVLGDVEEDLVKPQLTQLVFQTEI